MTSQASVAAFDRNISRAPRVLQVVASSFVIPFQILPLAQALAARGWNVDVATPPGREVETLDHPRMRHLPVPLDRRFATLRHIEATRALIRVLKAEEYDLVHLHGPIASMLGRVAARITRTPVLYHCRGTYYEDDHALLSEKITRRAYPLLERALAPWTDWTLTLTPQDAADLVSKAGFRPERVECLGAGGFGLDLDDWSADHFDDKRRAELRARFGVPEGRTVIGYVGRLVRAKGVFELIEAFAELRRTRADIHLLVVGETEAGSREPATGEQLKQAVFDAGLVEAVTFTGHLRAPIEAVALMDVLTLPSYSESFGQVLIEAGAMGVPVVAAENRGTRFSVVDGETGLLAPPRDPAALASALARLLDDPKMAARMGAAGLARSRIFSRERVIGRILEIYDMLAAGAAPKR